MANEIDSNVIPLMRTAVPVSIGVSPVEDGQKLPQDGNSLPSEKRATPSSEVLSSAVDKMNQYVQAIRRELEFSIDENSGRTVIKVLDAETKEVIRQIPAEEVVSLAQNLARQESVLFSGET